MINSILRKLRLMISRAVVSVVDDSYKRQNLQASLLAGEVANNIERFQNYGQTSVPPSNSEAIVLSIGGKRQHLVAISVDDKETRLKDLKSGDSAIYHMDGHYLLLTENGKALLVCSEFEVKAESILFDAVQSTFTGEVTILENIIIAGDSTANNHESGSISGNSHVHRCSQCNNATTTPPIEG